MFQKKRNTFHGGVHPYEGKELSKDKPIVKAQPGNLLYYAVSQHIGAPAVPIVQKGDHVKAGQKNRRSGRICFGSCLRISFRHGKRN